jgi:hypothetical protein
MKYVLLALAVFSAALTASWVAQSSTPTTASTSYNAQITRIAPKRILLAQNSQCYSNCASQEKTCERGCNAGGANGWSMTQVQACFVGCESGQQGCAARCSN